jgi:TatA/E family protein of Tat protein translocase
MSPLLAWTIGLPEVLVVGLVVLLLFGSRIPSLMRSMGRGVVEFKKGVSGIDDDEPGTDADLGPGTSRDKAPIDTGRRV